MLRVLRHPTYARLFAAQVVALLGTGVATVALGLLTWNLAGEQAGGLLGAVFAVKMVAYVFVAPLAAALVAGLPRRAVMVGADMVRLLAACALPFVTQTWQIFVLVFVLQAASATFTPTFQSVIPVVLPDEDDYTRALSLSRLAYDLEAIASPMLAAALLLFMPAQALFAATGVGFAASALLVLAAALPRTLGLRTHMDAPTAPLGSRARSGWALFFRTPALRPLLALNMVVASTVAFVLVQTVVLVREVLGLPEEAVALYLAINGLGSIVAALALPRVLTVERERNVMLGGAALLVTALAVVGTALGRATPGLAVVLAVLWFIIGVGWSATETPMSRIIRRAVPEHCLNEAFAAQFSLSHACWLITYPLVGALGAISLTRTAIGMAIIAGVAASMATVSWKSSVRVPARVGERGSSQ